MTGPSPSKENDLFVLRREGKIKKKLFTEILCHLDYYYYYYYYYYYTTQLYKRHIYYKPGGWRLKSTGPRPDLDHSLIATLLGQLDYLDATAAFKICKSK